MERQKKQHSPPKCFSNKLYITSWVDAHTNLSVPDKVDCESRCGLLQGNQAGSVYPSRAKGFFTSVCLIRPSRL